MDRVQYLLRLFCLFCGWNFVLAFFACLVSPLVSQTRPEAFWFVFISTQGILAFVSFLIARLLRG